MNLPLARPSLLLGVMELGISLSALLALLLGL